MKFDEISLKFEGRWMSSGSSFVACLHDGRTFSLRQCPRCSLVTRPAAASTAASTAATKAHYVMLSLQVLDSKNNCLAYVNFSTHVCYYVIIYTREGLFHLGKFFMEVNWFIVSKEFLYHLIFSRPSFGLVNSGAIALDGRVLTNIPY